MKKFKRSFKKEMSLKKWVKLNVVKMYREGWYMIRGDYKYLTYEELCAKENFMNKKVRYAQEMVKDPFIGFSETSNFGLYITLRGLD